MILTYVRRTDIRTDGRRHSKLRRPMLSVNNILFLGRKQAVWPPGSADTICPSPSVTLTFDRLTLKLVCESHLRWGTFIPNLGTLGLWVLELFAIYATDGQTDGQKQRLLPFPTVGGILNGVRTRIFLNLECIFRRIVVAKMSYVTFHFEGKTVLVTGGAQGNSCNH